MKILKGEEAKKIIDKIAKEKALSDEAMEDVTGGCTVFTNITWTKGRQGASLSQEEYDWLINSDAGKILLEHFKKMKHCVILPPREGEDAHAVIDNDPGGFELLIALLKNNGFEIELGEL